MAYLAAKGSLLRAVAIATAGDVYRNMHKFIANNRQELIARCKAKVARRPKREASAKQLENGIPLFLEQLRRTLQAEEYAAPGVAQKISGASGGDVHALSEMGLAAVAHGKELLALGFTVDQVVHDYGDLCQAITDLAVERDAPFAVDEFRTLNRCLDNAIADAVTGFSEARDAAIDLQHLADADGRTGLLHELRSALQTATLAAGALERGNLSISGSVGSVLKRAQAAQKALIERALNEASAPTTAAEDEVL